MGDLKDPKLHWRYLGDKVYHEIPVRNIGRSVLEVVVDGPAEDFEYYIEASGEAGKVFFPATSPATNAVVIVIEEPLSTTKD